MMAFVPALPTVATVETIEAGAVRNESAFTPTGSRTCTKAAQCAASHSCSITPERAPGRAHRSVFFLVPGRCRMTTMSYSGIARFAVAGLLGLAACSIAGDNLPTSIKAPTSAQFQAVGDLTDDTPELGVLKVCKTGNASGEFTLARSQFGSIFQGYIFDHSATFTLDLDVCRVVAVDNGLDGVWSILTLTETSIGLVSVAGERIDVIPGTTNTIISALNFTNGDSHAVNSFHGAVITFENFVAPPQVCDFITFGRLVTEVNGQKVVISGNAGGNKPGGGILGEFHIEANGVDNHVADIDSYEPAGALLDLTNARIVKGTAKNGVAVELRLWDGGEPGKGTDRVWVKLGNSVLIGGPLGQLIDQGNMQYHDVCRGPGDETLE
jgi:hypothetical protein